MESEKINVYYMLKRTNSNQCKSCSFVTAKMVKTSDGYLRCYDCAEKQEVLGKKETVIYLNDSKFLCPAQSCNSEDVSFWEHFYGSCCEAGSFAAFKRNHGVDLMTIDFAKRINGQDLAKMSDGLNDLKLKDENAKQLLAAVATQRKRIESKAEEIFTEARDSLLEDQEKKEDKLSDCKICFEKYDKFERFHCTLLCGHRACLRCLKAVPDKLCSTCRQPYTLEQIIKLY